MPQLVRSPLAFDFFEIFLGLKFESFSMVEFAKFQPQIAAYLFEVGNCSDAKASNV